ncbi:O-antigen ligase family protein [Microlunatus flavus]|uniref:O-Antigen ligase n=1 Tax=Microlunatus flavus TaxID=1036181 RepID=A0A1H8ZBD0_9ACTN|nr:O-antigen ligase family protein [Microlunatus flavus]SEP61730.1 O-Antigen ligase [Microlunatus flavus]
MVGSASTPRPGSRRFDQAGVLFVLVAAWAVVPKVLQTLTAPKYRVWVGQAEPPPTALTSAATTLLTAALLGWCLLVVLDALRRNPRRHLGGLLLLLAPWVWVVVRGWTLGSLPGVSDLVYPAVVVAVWLLRPGRRHLRLLGHLVGVVALLSVVIAVALPDQGVFRAVDGSEITEEKAFLPFGVLVGIFTHGNVLGQYLLMGLPLVALVRPRLVRAAWLALVAGALAWSAARSSIGAAAGLAAAVGVLSLLPRDRRSVPYRLVLWGAFGLVAVLPFVTHDPMAFTTRGRIWAVSLDAWRAHPWLGLGSDFYAQVAQTSGNLGPTVSHGHNEVVQLLVTGGVVLLVLTGLLLLAAIRRAADAPDGDATGFALLLALAGASLLEISLLPTANSVFDAVLLLPLATLLVGDPWREDPDADDLAGATGTGTGTRSGPVRLAGARG